MIRFVLSRRPASTAIMTVGLIAIVGLVILSPFALAELTHFRHDWSQLSNIGQTFGAVSAVISSLALGGILASLLYQARSTRNAYEQMIRTLQLELIKMELADSSLMTAMGAPWDVNIPSDSKSIRDFLYVQLWVSFWGGNYTIGDLPELAVRHFAAHELFRGRAGREYWRAVGHLQMTNSKGRLNKFFRILDDEYRKVISSGVPPANPVEADDISKRSSTSSLIRTKQVQQVCIVATAAFAGAIASQFWRRKRVKLRFD
jgi:Family of unknown function (DUF6082)